MGKNSRKGTVGARVASRVWVRCRTDIRADGNEVFPKRADLIGFAHGLREGEGSHSGDLPKHVPRVLFDRARNLGQAPSVIGAIGRSSDLAENHFVPIRSAMPKPVFPTFGRFHL